MATTGGRLSVFSVFRGGSLFVSLGAPVLGTPLLPPPAPAFGVPGRKKVPASTMSEASVRQAKPQPPTSNALAPMLNDSGGAPPLSAPGVTRKPWPHVTHLVTRPFGTSFTLVAA